MCPALIADAGQNRVDVAFSLEALPFDSTIQTQPQSRRRQPRSLDKSKHTKYRRQSFPVAHFFINANMASFMVDLMNSIFTPGPTSSLVLATNVSFACLQVVLFTLLIATYSIHFFILSVICGGLWAAINWFVKELALHEAQQRQKKESETAKEGAESGSESDTDAQTIVEEVEGSGSKEVEVLPPAPGLIDRGVRDKQESQEVKGSEVSTEDEWEKVSEAEKDK